MRPMQRERLLSPSPRCDCGKGRLRESRQRTLPARPVLSGLVKVYPSSKVSIYSRGLAPRGSRLGRGAYGSPSVFSCAPGPQGKVRLASSYPQTGRVAAIQSPRMSVERARPNVLSRIRSALSRLWPMQRCGYFYLDEPPPPHALVREPRRPRPLSPGGAISLRPPDYPPNSRSAHSGQ